MCLCWGTYCCANRKLARLTMAPTPNNNGGIITEHWMCKSTNCNSYNMVHFGVTFPSMWRQECVWTNHGMLNLVRACSRMLKLVWVAPRLLKLVRAGHCLLNLVWADPFIIISRGSGAALVCDGRGRGRYRRTCGGSLCFLWPRCWPGMDFSLSWQGRLLRSASPNINACASGASSCLLVGSRKTLIYGCIGCDGLKQHRRRKDWRNPLLFLNHQIYLRSVFTFFCPTCSSLPRKLCKNTQQILTSVAVLLAVRWSPWCI